MSFWKKMFGKNNEEVVEEQSDEIHLEADLISDTNDVNNDLIADESTESLASEEVEIELIAEEVNQISEAESVSTSEVEDYPEQSKPEVSDSRRENTTEDSEAQETKSQADLQAAEDLLKEELESAETAALNAQLEIEKQEFLEDLTVLDGRILPQLKVPDWREELEFVKERYEPCDLSDHIVKVSKRRLTARQIDHELAESRKNAYLRYFDRASRRFKEKIDEDALLNQALTDLAGWKNEQGKSVAWKLADRINEEVVKAKKAEEEATAFVENNIEFVNPAAVKVYSEFSRRAWLIPIVTLYITSVVGLTYNRFEWIIKFLPFFNLGLAKTLIMISGVAAGFFISNLCLSYY